MADFYVYSKPTNPDSRLELTPKGMKRLAERREEIAKTWFERLKRKGLIPKEAQFEKSILDYQSEQTDNPSPTPTYRDALIALLGELDAAKTDTDSDSLYDFDSAVLLEKMEEKGIIPKLKVSEKQLMEALLSRDSGRALRETPPEFTYYCDDLQTVSPHVGALPGGGGVTIGEPVEAEDTKVKDFKQRFKGNPYAMAEVTAYFKEFAKTHSEEEVLQELEAYLQAYYVHADDSPLTGSNVSEQLRIDASSDLTAYFTLYQGRAVVDCNIFAEVAATALRGSGMSNLSVSFISVSYFDEKRDHVVIGIRAGNKFWIISNNILTPMEAKTYEELAKRLGADKYLVAHLAEGETLAQAMARSRDLTPLQGLQSRYTAVRLNALIYLSKHPDPACAKALVQIALKEKDPQMRLYAATALRRIYQSNPEKTIGAEALLTALETETDFSVQLEIIQALYAVKKIDQQQYVQHLQQILAESAKEKDPYFSISTETGMRIATITKLLIQEGKAGFDILSQVFNDAGTYSEAFQGLVIESLHRAFLFGKLSKEDQQEFLKLAEKALTGLAANEAVALLEKLGEKDFQTEVIDILERTLSLPLLSNPYSPLAQRCAIQLLDRLAIGGDKRAVRVLVKALEYPLKEIRDYAVSALAQLDGGKDVWKTERPLIGELLDPALQDQAAELLIQHIQVCLKEDVIDLRTGPSYYCEAFYYSPLGEALGLLGRIGGEKAAKFLKTLVDDLAAIDTQSMAGPPVNLKTFKLGQITPTVVAPKNAYQGYDVKGGRLVGAPVFAPLQNLVGWALKQALKSLPPAPTPSEMLAVKPR